jgi:ABC-type uncharacterized transport system substrate-binding protein
MKRRSFVVFIAALFPAFVHLAYAQQARVFRVGVIHEGGVFNATVAGLRSGLRELGLEEGKHLVLEIRDVKGDLKMVEGAARDLVRERVDLIYSIATSPTIAVKRATADVPIVFAIGSDPVVAGLVESFAKPGGAPHGRPLSFDRSHRETS